MNVKTDKEKLINGLVKKKIKNLQVVYGGVACSVPTKPIVITQCYVCTVTQPKDPNGPVQV